MANAPKGTKDLLPLESYKWQYIEQTARETANLFGAKEIRTPTFEHTEVFLRGVGETTDIVNKEMYTFQDKGDRSITLKPEGTAGAIRAFVENGLFNSTLPAKMYYLTSCFRYERPQAGRLREFHQFGIEVLGSDQPSIDAETISLAKSLFDRLGVTGLKLYINSIGCKTCRAEYQKALTEYLSAQFDNLCPLCKERLSKNPLRVLDCKNHDCKEITKNAPNILDYICEDCSSHFEKLKKLLTLSGIEYEVDSNIVRGLDYYTKTVFEFVSQNIGAQGTVCGGGRYDGLVEQFGGGKVTGIGFAVGIERLVMLLENLGVEIPNQNQLTLYIAPMGEQEGELAYKIASELRAKGVSVDIDHMQRGIKAQFKYANKIGAKFVAVIGSSEMESGEVNLKNMQSGEEKKVAIADLYDNLN